MRRYLNYASYLSQPTFVLVVKSSLRMFFKVLASEDHKDKRWVKEVMLIKLNPTLNRDGGLDLPLVYGAIQWSRDG